MKWRLFSSSTKSALDMLVKVLCVVTGKPATTFPTYGNSGSKLLPTLHQLKRDKKLNLTHGRIDWLIEIIEKAKSPWLEWIISIRDTFSHFQSDINFGFGWDPESETVMLPSFETQGGYEQFDLVMAQLIDHLIRYCSDFIAVSITCAIPLEQEIQQMSANEREYMSALWNQDLSRAEWWPARNVIIHYTEQDIEQARQKAKAANR